MNELNNDSQLLIYQSPSGEVKIDVRLDNETVWLTQAQMAELFGKSRSTITEHISNIFKESELDEKLVCRNFRHTTQHGAIEGKTQSKIHLQRFWVFHRSIFLLFQIMFSYSTLPEPHPR
ncbi:MAG TPA: hypothetical protein VHO70_23115, partial [Chitinispirillaceae bacterium]|nr:hypothetical protein [Chitinispirillaceae bacterium]